MTTSPRYACRTCGTVTAPQAGARCPNCWEVETRLATYLRSRAGQIFVQDCVLKAVVTRITQDLQGGGHA